MSIVEINDLTFRYKNNFVFDNFNLKIDRGSWVTIAGPNGSGKTTLVKLLAGLEKSYSCIKILDYVLDKKNLFDISNVTGFQTISDLTYQSYYGSVSVDKVITCRYGAYGQGLVLKDWSKYLKAGTYTISADCYYSTTANTSSYKITANLFQFGIASVSPQKTITPDTWARLSFTVNIPSDGDYYLCVQPVGNAGAFYPINVQFKNVQVEEGSTATDYEPYKEVLKVSYNTRNLLPYPWVNTTKTQNGLTFTDNGDGSLTISGTATAETYFVLQNNKNYGSSPINAIETESATNGQYTVSKRLYYNGVSKTLSVNILNGAAINETIYPQIELGTTATDYVPYFNTVVWTYKQPVLTGYNIT